MTGEVNNRIFDNPLKTNIKSGDGNVKSTQNGTSGSTGSIFTFKPDAKISPHQLGTPESTESFFNEFDLDKDGYISSRNSNGVNEFELLNKRYEEINSAKSDKPASTNPVVKMYKKVVNFFKNDNGLDVYRDGEVIAAADGKIDQAFQGEELGDCWLLAKLSAMSNTDFGAEGIRETIAENETARNPDGSYTINIKRIGEKYTFSRDEIQAAIDSGKYSSGDLDVLLFELGLEKHYDAALAREDENDINEGRKATSASRVDREGFSKSSIEGGNTRNDYQDPHDFKNKDIIGIITGAKHLYADKKEQKLEVLNLKAQYPRDIAATFSSNYAITLDDDGNTHIEKMNPEDNYDYENHEYELKSVEKDEQGNITKVIVINPWNNKEDLALTPEEFEKVCIDIGFNTKNDEIIGKYNDACINIKAKELENTDLKFFKISETLGNTNNIADISKSMGGLKNLHERFMSIVEKETEEVYNAYTQNGIDGMNKYAEYEFWGNEDKKYIDDFMQKSKEERVIENKKSFYESLGFDAEEVSDLIQNPEKFEQYCNLHGYQY